MNLKTSYLQIKRLPHFSVALSLTVLLLYGCGSTKSNSTVNNKSSHAQTLFDTKKKEQVLTAIIKNAHKELGVPYKYGGVSSKGFDCSGLIVTLYKQQELILPHNSLQLSKKGMVLNLKKDKINKGDLVFFSNNKEKIINHVGLIIDASNEEIKFIHASTSKGVIISSTKETYYKKNLVQANRLF